VPAKPTERTPGVLEEKGQAGKNERPKTSNDTDPKPADKVPRTSEDRLIAHLRDVTPTTSQNVNESSPKTAHQAKPQRVRVSGGVQSALLVTKVQPVYPPLAVQTRVSGTVKLHAIIGKDGAVQQLELLDGHPLLVQSAVDAVKQWRYRPTLLNGEPVEVDTEIDVIFALTQ
jgi:TonB family protein